MYCKECGAEINNDAKFCPSCGAPVTETSITTYKRFSIKEFLSLGWETLKNNFLPSFLVTVILLFGILIPELKIGIILSWIISIYTSLILTRIAIAVPEGKFKLEKELFFSSKGNTLNYFIADILFSLALIVGFALLILPGIYLLIRFSMWNFIIIEQKCSPIEALSKSWELTRGYTLQLFQWEIVSAGINILGLLFLIIGLVISIPLTTFSEYYIYKKLAYGK